MVQMDGDDPDHKAKQETESRPNGMGPPMLDPSLQLAVNTVLGFAAGALSTHLLWSIHYRRKRADAGADALRGRRCAELDALRVELRDTVARVMSLMTMTGAKAPLFACP